MDILRDQTQRRLDKDLVGKELLKAETLPGRATTEYETDDDWDEFTEHGGLPRNLGGTDIIRLTTSSADYRALRRGLHALGTARTVWRPTRLGSAEPADDTRQTVVLKEESEGVEGLHYRPPAVAANPSLGDSALVIDDESDQASLNIRRRTRAEREAARKERNARTSINGHIVELLGALHRSQYVGYTATPFANVFVDPNDASDLFPKDFIEVLRKPDGYMGIEDFFGLSGSAATGRKEEDFVRHVSGADDAKHNLPEAIDAFLLAGAVKLFRQKAGERVSVRHHTMLIHTSSSQDAHDADRAKVEECFIRGKYFGKDSLKRLETLYESDFARVSAKRRTATGASTLPEFVKLHSYLEEVLDKVKARPVRVVNGRNPGDTPDFERSRVWSILVGGTKLSRGYTVEGLTVGYYRRHPQTADALMQMGRWFGFREGYSDLVRLYVDRPDEDSADGFDLLEAFKGVCADEQVFRETVRRYSIGTSPRLLPKDLPPGSLSSSAADVQQQDVQCRPCLRKPRRSVG